MCEGSAGCGVEGQSRSRHPNVTPASPTGILGYTQPAEPLMLAGRVFLSWPRRTSEGFRHGHESGKGFVKQHVDHGIFGSGTASYLAGRANTADLLASMATDIVVRLAVQAGFDGPSSTTPYRVGLLASSRGMNSSGKVRCRYQP